MIKLKYLHIELTSRCTLKCLRCARTDWLNSDEANSFTIESIELTTLTHFLSDVNLDGCKIELSGNIGDPIYHSDLPGVISYLKSRGAILQIRTNGSYRTVTWWRSIADVVTADDMIVFGVDGVRSNFEQYRENADFDSIVTGMTIMANSPIITQWRYIIFSFNEHTVDEAKKMATEIGIDQFNVVASNRWIENDPLTPVSSVMVINRPGTTDIFEPECQNGIDKTLFISAAGHFYPCCYSADYRLRKGTIFGNNPISIYNTTIGKLLTDTETIPTFLRGLHNNKLPACNFCCTK